MSTLLNAAAFIFSNGSKRQHIFEGGIYSRAAFNTWHRNYLEFAVLISDR